jgi:CBS domain-containing protein
MSAARKARTTPAAKAAPQAEAETLRVERLMTSKPAACGPGATLADAARIMWEDDCGCVPVVDGEGHLIGIVTDRDIAVACATRDRSPSQLGVVDVMSGQDAIVSCRPGDEAHTALALMAQHRVRRIPVTSEDGMLVGLLSLNDLILEAGRPELDDGAVMAALRDICAHRQSLVAATSGES